MKLCWHSFTISLSLETAGTVAWGLGCMASEDGFFFFTFFGIPGAGKIKQMYTQAYIMKSSENYITKIFKLPVCAYRESTMYLVVPV